MGTRRTLVTGMLGAAMAAMLPAPAGAERNRKRDRLYGSPRQLTEKKLRKLFFSRLAKLSERIGEDCDIRNSWRDDYGAIVQCGEHIAYTWSPETLNFTPWNPETCRNAGRIPAGANTVHAQLQACFGVAEPCDDAFYGYPAIPACMR